MTRPLHPQQPRVKHHRRLKGGGAVALVLPQGDDEWVWRLRGVDFVLGGTDDVGRRGHRSGSTTYDWPEDEFASIDEFLDFLFFAEVVDE